MTHRLTGIGNTQKKTETFSNKGIFIINTLEFLKHEILPREHGFHRQQVDHGSKSSAVTEAFQQRTVSVTFCRGAFKFRSSAGYRSIVWLLPIYAHFRFTHSYRVVERREREDRLIPSFLLLRIQPNVDEFSK